MLLSDFTDKQGPGDPFREYTKIYKKGEKVLEHPNSNSKIKINSNIKTK